MSSEQEEQPEKIPRPGLFCHSCGERGKVFEFPESIAIRDEVGESELDLPLFRCENCGTKWYDASDVVSLVLIYRLQFSGPEKSGSESDQILVSAIRLFGGTSSDRARAIEQIPVSKSVMDTIYPECPL